MRASSLRQAVPVVALVFLGACHREKAPAPPSAEFLLEAGDSTFWVTTSPDGVHLRGAPIQLARWGGRFYEIYVTDDDRSFYDAVLIGQRVYRRDLLTDDSIGVFADTLIATIARQYAAEHPNERPLRDDEDESSDPRTVARSSVDLLDAAGPYLSYEYRADVNVVGGEESHVLRRGVVDLRTGTPVQVADLFGDTVARRVIATARDEFSAVVDSVLATRDDRARKASSSLADFMFDEHSFALTDSDAQPTIEFLVPGSGEDAGGYTLELPAVHAHSTGWWAETRAELPAPGDAPEVDRWQRRGYQIVARYDTVDESALVTLSDSARHEWPLGRLPGPVHRIYFLDQPPVDSATRRGLVRAFSEAALYSDDARTAALPHAPAHHPAPSIPVLFDAPFSHRQGITTRDVRAHDAAAREQPRARVRRRHSLDDGSRRRRRRHPARAVELRDGVGGPRGLPGADSSR